MKKPAPPPVDVYRMVSTRVESHPGTAPDTADQPNQAGSRSDDGKPGTSSSAATNSARTPEWPQCGCTNCASNRREALAVIARVRLARQAVRDREPWGVLANHIVELVAMLEARGLA